MIATELSSSTLSIDKPIPDLVATGVRLTVNPTHGLLTAITENRHAVCPEENVPFYSQGRYDCTAGKTQKTVPYIYQSIMPRKTSLAYSTVAPEPDSRLRIDSLPAFFSTDEFVDDASAALTIDSAPTSRASGLSWVDEIG